MSGGILLIKRFAVHTVRKAFQRHRTFCEMSQQPGRHAYVIFDDLRLGESGGRVEDFVQIGQCQRLSPDLYMLYNPHARIVTSLSYPLRKP